MANHSENFHRIASIWEKFVSGQSDDLSALRPEIAASWIRCREQGVSPEVTQVPVADKPISMLDTDLKEASIPIVPLLRDAIRDARALVAVTNRDAEVLEVMGDADALAAGERINAVAGASWKEPVAGTNCAGTGIVVAQPLEVNFFEHYLAACHQWAGFSAPICHPLNGSMLGVLAIAGVGLEINDSIRSFAHRGADLVRQLLASVQASDQIALMRTFDDFSRRYQDAMLLAVDAYGYVAQTTPENGSRPEASGHVRGRRISEVIGFEAIAQLQKHERACELNVPLASGAKAFAHPVYHGSRLVGAIVVFTPTKRTAQRQAEKPEKSWSSRFTFADIVGESPLLGNSVRLATRAARTDYPVLILGESGTGKELFAHAIHDLSPRRDGPFVAFNFGAMSEELTISEMCGHEPGAFTGANATTTKAGIIDSAKGGTLFVDELQDAGPKAQSLLLRFIETGTFIRVGGTSPVQSDVRVIAASNVPDEDLARRVRPDLLYRLNSITVRIPPLRERLEDIRPIAERHLRKLSFRGSVVPEVWGRLREYHWPGNVRELQNALLRATLNCNGLDLTPEDLPQLTRPGAQSGAHYNGNSAHAIANGHDPEAETVLNAMREANGNVNKAAQILGVHRSTLYRRLLKLGIEPRP